MLGVLAADSGPHGPFRLASAADSLLVQGMALCGPAVWFSSLCPFLLPSGSFHGN